MQLHIDKKHYIGLYCMMTIDKKINILYKGKKRNEEVINDSG